MHRLICSVPAMILIAASTFFGAVSNAITAVFYATLGPSSTTGLLRAAGWLTFVSGVAALIAVGIATWESVLRKAWLEVGETSIAAIATLLYAVGLLIAASSLPPDRASYVLSAVGIGLWALLTLGRAARVSLTQDEPLSGTRHRGSASLWLAAAGGLLILAIGYGMTDYYLGTTTVIVTSGILMSLGIAALATTLAVARRHGLVRSGAVPAAIAGLAVLAGAVLASAVVEGFEFGAGGTITGIRIGASVTLAFQASAWLILTVAAWIRVRSLYPGHRVAHDQHPASVP